jgi:hypothetical protein
MWEFRIIRGADSDVQKIINQWKHKYDVKIGETTHFSDGKVAMNVVRTEKKGV